MHPQRFIVWIFHAMWWLYGAITKIFHDRQQWVLDSHRREAEALHRHTVENYLQDPTPSGLLGNARLGNLTDARNAGLLTGNGLFLGSLDDHPLFYNGPSHLLTIAKNRSGKGRDVILPNLAMVEDRSIVVLCLKNGENTFASLEHRARIGSKIICLNPDHCLGLPNTGLNPLDVVVRAVQNRDKPLEVAQELASMIIPIGNEERDKWPKEGAQELFIIISIALAHLDPARCTLGEVNRFLQRADAEIVAELKKFGSSDAPAGIPGMALAKAGAILSAKAQWEAWRSCFTSALMPFAPGETFTEATARTEADFSRLKQELTTVYIIVDGTALDGAAKWMALVLNALFDIVAKSEGDGRVLFLLDEFLQLPVIPRLSKALNLYPGLGIQLWPFVQDLKGLIGKYGAEFAANLEQGADILQMWGIEDETLLRRIEYLSGRTTVAIRGLNTSNAQVSSTSFGISEHSRPLLQVEDIRTLHPRKQIIRVPHYPLFIADRHPYYDIEECAKVLRDPRDVRRDTVLHIPDPGST